MGMALEVEVEVEVEVDSSLIAQPFQLENQTGIQFSFRQ
jgi:hypothetical protein